MPNWNTGETHSDAPRGGDLQWDDGIGQLKVYNGAQWVPLHAPTNSIDPTNGATEQGGNVVGLGVTSLPITTGTPSFAPADLNGTTGFAGLVFDIVGHKLWAHTGATWFLV